MGGIDEVPSLVGRLYAVVDELEAAFPGRYFTPDGHLVGSLGEVWAAHLYGLDLLPASAPQHDGVSPCGRQVQVKATQRTSVALNCQPDHLIVLLLSRHGDPEEVYNGPGADAWARVGPRQKTSLCHISVSTLRALMKSVGEELRLPRIAQS